MLSGDRVVDIHIDKVSTGKSYLFKNITVQTFDDVKYVNTNKATTITEIDDIQNINIESVELEHC